MTSISPETSAAPSVRRRRLTELLPREVWASLAITVMWLAVLLDALFGPDLVFANTGLNTTTSGMRFAWLNPATIACESTATCCRVSGP